MQVSTPSDTLSRSACQPEEGGSCLQICEVPEDLVVTRVVLQGIAVALCRLTIVAVCSIKQTIDVPTDMALQVVLRKGKDVKVLSFCCSDQQRY
jgi:hypothetical protein